MYTFIVAMVSKRILIERAPRWVWYIKQQCLASCLLSSCSLIYLKSWCKKQVLWIVLKIVSLRMSMSGSKCKGCIGGSKSIMQRTHSMASLYITRLEKKCEKLSKNAKAFLDAMRGNTREGHRRAGVCACACACWVWPSSTTTAGWHVHPWFYFERGWCYHNKRWQQHS